MLKKYKPILQLNKVKTFLFNPLMRSGFPSSGSSFGFGCSKNTLNTNLRFVMVEGVGVVVVRRVGFVQSLKSLLLFLYKVGVGACAGRGYPSQPAVGPGLIPGWNWRWGRWSWSWSWGWGGGWSRDLSWYGDGGWS